MKPTNIISPVYDILFVIGAGFSATFTAILFNPALLFNWRSLSKIFMANHWTTFGNLVDENTADMKTKLLTASGYVPGGVILDLGAGHGHTVKYLHRSRVKCYVALEPNVLMHPYIRRIAEEHGYSESDGSLIILSCGAEDSSHILSSLASAGLNNPQPIDAIISILTLCSVPNPQGTIHHLVRDVLRSGGVFFMLEHVLSPREDVRKWQRVWAPIWALLFDGCRMDRATDLTLKSLELAGSLTAENAWREWKTWPKEGESEESLFWECSGRFVKK